MRAIARKLDYRPNASAQRLARRKSGTITVIIPHISNYFFVELLGGIQDILFDEDYDLLLCGVNQPGQIETFLQRSLRGGHSDGILLASTDLPPGCAQKFLKNNFPVILIDRCSDHFDSFYVANIEGARTAAKYMLRLGHQRIAMIAGNPETTPSRQRSQGYNKAFESYPGAVNTGIFYPDLEKKNDGFSCASGYEAAKKILSLPIDQCPTAMFVASDIQAIGVIRALREAGLSIPEDISIVGFNDIELARYYGLTTIRQPIHEMAVAATQRLFERIDDPSLEVLNKQYLPDLIERNTSAPPRKRNREHHQNRAPI